MSRETRRTTTGNTPSIWPNCGNSSPPPIQEYRTRLISDVVTGQVDVRGIEAPELAGKALPPLDESASKSDYDNSGRESILGEEGIKP